MKSSVKKPICWASIITSVVVAIAAELGVSLEETSIAGGISAVITFFTSRLVEKKKEK